MILNNKCFCRKYLKPNASFYLEIRNKCPFFIHPILYYTLQGTRITKPGPVIPPDKMQRIAFPGDAMNLDFDVYNSSTLPPTLICNTTIPNNMSSCFQVIINAEGYLRCIEC